MPGHHAEPMIHHCDGIDKRRVTHTHTHTIPWSANVVGCMCDNCLFHEECINENKYVSILKNQN